jgi:hypothetical protein
MKIVSLKLKPYAVSPVTFEPVYKHPLLTIGVGNSTLTDEVKEWLDKNCTNTYKFVNSTYVRYIGSEELDVMSNEEMAMWGYHLCFESDHDATLFSLRWL